MANEDNVRIRKVSVVALLQTLAQIYNQGVNFVDIYGELNEDQDIVSFLFRRDYMDEEKVDFFDDMTEEKKRKLTDDDINQLI